MTFKEVVWGENKQKVKETLEEKSNKLQHRNES